MLFFSIGLSAQTFNFNCTDAPNIRAIDFTIVPEGGVISWTTDNAIESGIRLKNTDDWILVNELTPQNWSYPISLEDNLTYKFFSKNIGGSALNSMRIITVPDDATRSRSTITMNTDFIISEGLTGSIYIGAFNIKCGITSIKTEDDYSTTIVAEILNTDSRKREKIDQAFSEKSYFWYEGGINSVVEEPVIVYTLETDPVYRKIDFDDINTYYAAFVEDAKRHSVTVPEQRKINFYLVEPGTTLGSFPDYSRDDYIWSGAFIPIRTNSNDVASAGGTCNDGIVKIFYDINKWSTRSNITKLNDIWHELSHDLFSLPHIPGATKAIMGRYTYDGSDGPYTYEDWVRERVILFDTENGECRNNLIINLDS